MEAENHGKEIVRRHRRTAIWGGTIVGILVGAVIGGPNLASWSEPAKTYAGYLLIGGAIGAVVGYFFYEIFLSGLASAGPSSGVSAPGGTTRSGLGEEGDSGDD